MTDIQGILKRARTIAVVGLSPNPDRTSHKIARYLQEQGYRIIPVNPNVTELLGEKSYPSLLDVPASVEIDIVDIFRRPEFTAGVVRDAIERREYTANNPVIWTQIGVSSPEAENLARGAGMTYVRNRCALVEHSRYLA